MVKRKTKYNRCKKCKELVIDPDNCANCANRDPNASHRWPSEGKRGTSTLDIQEGNMEEWG